MKVSLPFTVLAEDMAAFAQVSGDYNPIHTDADFARSRGFQGPLVYGGLLLAQVSRVIGMRLPGRNAVWTRVEMDFRKPLMVGEGAHVEAEIINISQAVRQIELKLRISVAQRLLAKGMAEVLVLGND
ncbi:MAG: hypothetical protein A2516_08680 [Alphaproteobacteria bacterium RIFOXYD12_FULL_60_8]|nr:MAG: hypothetical protein A2516_08680 [Alphaproteobacteria bacterium RIFOXYD12_FULL_60_8]